MQIHANAFIVKVLCAHGPLKSLIDKDQSKKRLVNIV